MICSLQLGVRRLFSHCVGRVSCVNQTILARGTEREGGYELTWANLLLYSHFSCLAHYSAQSLTSRLTGVSLSLCTVFCSHACRKATRKTVTVVLFFCCIIVVSHLVLCCNFSLKFSFFILLLYGSKQGQLHQNKK